MSYTPPHTLSNSVMKAFLLATLLACSTPLLHAADWKQEVTAQTHLLGHRNMIIVADSAYPIQTGSGIKVIATDAPHQEVVAFVAKSIAASPGIRAKIALDREFRYVPEKHAPGAAKLRESLLAVLKGKEAPREELHETLLKEVNQTAGEYSVVVFKTTCAIPYSSVFFTLDCGYWSAEAEKDLREAMKADPAK
ncbi:MAG: hypothetical protein QM755_03345 [Luteolibacter sp.]